MILQRALRILLGATLLGGSLASNILLATESSNVILPITSESVGSISVKPNKAQGASAYTLRIYSHDQGKAPSVTLTRSLSGHINNVEIRDIDNDGHDELIITTAHTASNKKAHFDIYEFTSETLFGRINQTLQLAKLFKLFD